MNETVTRMTRAWRQEEQRWSNRRKPADEGWEAVRCAALHVPAEDAPEAVHDLGPDQQAAARHYAELVDIACARAALTALRQPNGAVAEALDHSPGGHGREAWQSAIDAALR